MAEYVGLCHKQKISVRKKNRLKNVKSERNADNFGREFFGGPEALKKPKESFRAGVRLF